MDRDTFGQLLREGRQRALLTLESLAEASGVSVRAISDMERGLSLPRQATLAELMDALGLAGPERERLVRAAVRPGRQVRIPRQLPPDLPVFRGRDEILAAARDITDRSARGEHAVVAAIGGLAGVGKTALAVHWAHRVADRFPDGQLYVNLRGFEEAGEPLDPGEALGGFLNALGVTGGEMPTSTEQRGALFRERTASRRLIVVLDNARDADQVRPLLPGSAGCLTIITSRNRLPGVAVTEAASLIGLDVWTTAEAVAALAARIGEARCAAEPEAATELVELCGRLPLAVAVVGAQLSAVPQIPLRLSVRELRAIRPQLDALSADERRTDIRAVFSWSYQALTAGTARFFRYLSLHPGPTVSVEAAASLADVALPTARRHMRELTSASLLSRDAEGRFVMHDLVRAYGTELVVAERDDRLGAETRLLDYLRHNARSAGRFVTRYRSTLTTPLTEGLVHVVIDSRDEALAWFHQEEATIAAALRTLQNPRLLRHRVDLTHDRAGYTAATGRWTEEMAATRAGLDAALALDDPIAVMWCARHLSRALVATGRTDEADEPLDLMLAQLHRLPADHRAHAERNISLVRDRQGRSAESLRHARNALAIARELGKSDEIAPALGAVGWSLTVMGEHKEAIAACEEALVLLRGHGEYQDLAAVWHTIGYAQQALGDTTAAVAGYEQALRFQRENSDTSDRPALVLDDLASARLQQGDIAGARANWIEATRLLDELGSRRAAAAMRAKAEALPPQAPADGTAEPGDS
ncbi:ATP-binding protein [Streptomyces sp. NPDC001068]|uniref:ATP-binding protein n=1 Tax=Streptomyces sp. NPDC001068 TaxID=3364544 RepID=UPI0036BCD222